MSSNHGRGGRPSSGPLRSAVYLPAISLLWDDRLGAGNQLLLVREVREGREGTFEDNRGDQPCSKQAAIGLEHVHRVRLLVGAVVQKSCYPTPTVPRDGAPLPVRQRMVFRESVWARPETPPTAADESQLELAG